ncbi:MAG: DHA2 family efflux MFS transporter permease subunit [Alphaproteobacteria bacterium]|nr:DHA2 family efflux MFS transporter permease subunit [Alphaproteobacteria bacterium]MBU6473322.1 DHA2 family efflux MFS transporter permease subunit [Alphaproteobacteria bacterium]MDE2075101.1 DHA2 family efflux MFS transporter permease subunit [Alphaproteobacteria bacterium]MDE2350820.1 DHA2 family efflux MFS transporter permease subunit [Alphaproteobacteria bacterium]
MTAISNNPAPGESVRDTPLALRIAMTCAMMGSFMQVLDSTIANVALPYMQGSLQASRDQITWVLTSYVVAAAIMTAPVGWIASRFGRKNSFVVCMAGFTVTSMMCGAAQTLDQMILFRVLQGVFGAALSPLSQAIILDRYPPEKRGAIMSIWGMVVMVGPILGPTLGGYLTDNYTWRWVFYVNAPVGILATAGLVIFLANDKYGEAQSFDWTGFGFFTVAIGALQFLLDRGTTKDWFSSNEIITEAVLAGTGCYLFIVHFLTARRTFIPHGLLTDRNYMSALALTFFISLLMLATTALLPPFLQDLGGYSVLETGLMLAPRGLGTMITMFVIGRLVMRIDVRLPMAVGSAILTWSMWEMSRWTPDIAPMSLAVTTFFQGIGMGLVFIPSNIMAFATLPGHFRTDGAAMLNLVRNLGSAIGVSVTTTALANSLQTAHASLAVHVSPFNRALSYGAPGLMWNPHLPFGVAMINGVIEQNALVIAYSDVFYFMLLLSLPAFLVLALIPKPEPTLSSKTAPELEFIE